MLKINKRIKGVVINLALALATIVVFLVLLEIGLRWFYPQPLNPSFIPLTDRGTFAEYDPVLGWKLKPNVEGDFFSGDFITTVKNNKQGLRMGREIGIEKSKYRIAIIGDSAVWGFGVNDQDRISEQLEKKLEGVEVINFGVSGYGTGQYYLQLNRTVLKFKPDMVISVFYANDLLDLGSSIRYGYPKPVFELSDDGLELTNVPVPKREALGEASFSSLLKINFYLSHKFHTFVFFKPVLHRLYLLVRKPSAVVPYYIDILMKNYSEDYEEYKEINNKLYCQMSTMLKQRNISFVLVNLPYKTHILTNELKNLVKFYKINENEIDIKKPSIMLNNLSRNCNFNFIDLYPYFEQYDGKRDLYFRFDEHLTPLGNDYAADILSRELEKKNIIKK